MTQFGPATFLGSLVALAGIGALKALRLWPKGDPKLLENRNDKLPLAHPHLTGERRQSHTFVVNDEHPRWASQL